MSILLTKHFQEVSDIKQEEFMNFFKLDGSEREKSKLIEKYNNIKSQNQGVVDFYSISEQTKNYEKLINLLTSIEQLKTNLDDFLRQIQSQSSYKTDYLDSVTELMITLDIYQYIRNLSQSSYSSVNRYFEFMQTQTIKSQDAKQKIESIIKDAKQIIGVGNNGSDQIKYQKKESFAGFEPIQDENQNNQENFNQIQVQLDQIYSEIKNVRADIKQNDFHTNQEAFIDKNLSFFENQGVDNLTSNVWPKSRLLFAILSKMSKEGLINQEQKGQLKELVIESDSRLENYLRDYQQTGDKNNLYKNIVKLVQSNDQQNI